MARFNSQPAPILVIVKESALGAIRSQCNRATFNGVPDLQVLTAAVLDLGADVDRGHLDANGDWRRLTAFLRGWERLAVAGGRSNLTTKAMVPSVAGPDVEIRDVKAGARGCVDAVDSSGVAIIVLPDIDAKKKLGDGRDPRCTRTTPD